MSAPRAICRVSASRRWPPPARALPLRAAMPDAAVPRDDDARRICASSPRRPTAGQRRFRRRLCATIRTASPRTCGCCVETGVAGPVDRGLRPAMTPSRSTISISRSRACGRRARRSTRPAATSCSRAAAKAYPRPARLGRDHPPAEGLCRGRRRLPLRAGHQDARADRGGGEGGRAQAGQLSDVAAPPVFTVADLAGARRAAHQRRRHAGALGGAASSARRAKSPSEGSFDGFDGVIAQSPSSTPSLRDDLGKATA